VQAADQIVVMDEGKIVEKGNHEQLLRRNGIYADMYHKQLLDQEAERQDGQEHDLVKARLLQGGAGA
jgi:ATP-binding cassette subfamily B protein